MWGEEKKTRNGFFSGFSHFLSLIFWFFELVFREWLGIHHTKPLAKIQFDRMFCSRCVPKTNSKMLALQHFSRNTSQMKNALRSYASLLCTCLAIFTNSSQHHFRSMSWLPQAFVDIRTKLRCDLIEF
jgi:hypothetical protein